MPSCTVNLNENDLAAEHALTAIQNEAEERLLIEAAQRDPRQFAELYGDFQPMPTAIYLYVDNPDAVYARAMQAGCTSLWPPADQDYGDRVGGVQDPFGNHWYSATHIGGAR